MYVALKTDLVVFQGSNNILLMIYQSGLLKYKEINQILDEFVQHAIKLIVSDSSGTYLF